jgi:hypothetical protein
MATSRITSNDPDGPAPAGPFAVPAFDRLPMIGRMVSNILGKLGVATRTEAAAVAVRLGLAD